MDNGGQTDPIKHVVVLMLENRSFDQMLGSVPNVNGVDPANPGINYLNGTGYKQRANAKTIIDPDPKHMYPNVRLQLESGNGKFVYDYWCEYKSGMWKYLSLKHWWKLLSAQLDPSDIMDYFPNNGRGRLQALHTLAENFTVCDRWFSSVPGPTWPNRFFVHSGTSLGYVCMPEAPWFVDHLHWYKQETIYRRLSQKNVRWNIYYHDIPQSLVLTDLWSFRRNFQPIGAFFKQAKGQASDFPQYCFIEPRYGYGIVGKAFASLKPFASYRVRNLKPDLTKLPNDDHPPHDVDQGQALIADVYTALMSNKELWNSTLLIILYDEHGGFYDHYQALPVAIPPDASKPEKLRYKYPCGKSDILECRFDYLGVRVPAVLVSPWVKRGHVCSTPLDHTSILKYVSDKWLGHEPYLTQRVAGAHSITPCLEGGPGPEVPSPPITLEAGAAPDNLMELANQPLNDHQEALVAFTEALPEGHEETLDTNPLNRLTKRIHNSLLSPLARWALATERVEDFIGRMRE
jgi:phospholipase C